METIKAGDTEITLYSFSGKVLSTTRQEAGRGRAAGMVINGNRKAGAASFASTTVMLDQVIVKGANGVQKGFQLRGFDLSCGQGHRITTIWGIKKGKKEGACIAVHNHSTSETFYQEEELRKLFYFSRGDMMMRAAILSGCIGLLTGLSSLGSDAGILYVIYWILAGSAIGFFFRLTNKKAIERFKEELNLKV